MKKRITLIIFLIALAVIIIGIIFLKTYKGTAFNIQNIISISNPASQNCVDNGGIVEIRKTGDGQEYGVCILEDNRQCEEWSLFRGECPESGVRITGYVTDAAVYCAVLGGEYNITINEEEEAENGTCTFFSGQTCNVWDLYNGKCDKGEIEYINYNNNEYNFSFKFPSSWKDNYEVRESQNKIKVCSFLKGQEEAFRMSVISESFWKSNPEYSHLDYLGRYEDNFIAISFVNDSLKDEINRIKKTFKITKPYIFSEDSTEKGSNFKIEVKYPYLGAVDNAKVNIDINNFINNLVFNFKNSINKEGSWKGENTLKLYYEPYEINKKYISLRIETLEYTGGAHPLTTSYVFNYDIENGKIIMLSDIFNENKNYLDVISQKSIEYLLKINETDQFSDENWIREGAKASEQNYKLFTFNKDVIVFNFDQYQVAPYSSGRQQVIIPFKNIKEILDNEFVSRFELSV